MAKEIFLFISGLAYILFGFAIFIKMHQSGEHILTKGLKWLALFGISQGIGEWGQLLYIENKFYFLKFFTVMFTVLSYSFLLKFALSTIRRSTWGKNFKHLNSVLLTLWILICFLYPMFSSKFYYFNIEWLEVIDIIGRYLMGVPGAVFAIIGLVHTRPEIEKLADTELILSLKGMGLCLGLFAFFGGIIVPKGPIWPSNVLNEELMEQLFRVPVDAYRAVYAVIMIILIIKLLNIYTIDYQQKIIESREEFLLTSERERIGRDLHDGVIQTLYGIGMELRGVKAKAKDETLKNKLETMMKGIDQAIVELRYYVSGLPSTDEKVDFLQRLRNLLLDLNGTYKRPDFILETKLESLMITQSLSDQVYLFFHEALSNVAKHANATECEIKLLFVNNCINIFIADNGQGFEVKGKKTGLGLGSMKRRIANLNGRFSLQSNIDEGTEIRVTIPTGEVI